MIHIADTITECSCLWEQIPGLKPDCLFDNWDVRMCFQTSFGRRPAFIVAEKKGIINGILPLSYLEERGQFAFFPGETWHGRTWLESNRFMADSSETLREMLSEVNAPVELRYLHPETIPAGTESAIVDETGYHFLPPADNFCFTTYQQRFPSKSVRRIWREIDLLKARQVTFRFDAQADVDTMFRMNQEAFGEHSYFTDPRFLDAFQRLVAWLRRHNRLRTTTVLIDGKIGAIDIGALLNGNYTILAGATSPLFPGVAKLINFHHIERACQERFNSVDFLCGDFGWKSRFRLEPRPLYKLTTADDTTAEMPLSQPEPAYEL